MEMIKSKMYFSSKAVVTGREKVEIAMIMATSIILTAIFMFTFTPVHAEITAGEMENLIETILKIICFIAGAMFALVGIIKFAISHANDDGPAQQKAIMMMATGVVLVALGLAIPGIVQASWFEVN